MQFKGWKVKVFSNFCESFKLIVIYAGNYFLPVADANRRGVAASTWPPDNLFPNNYFTRKEEKKLYEIISQPLRCSPLEIMLKGSLVLISQIMVMNNKEYGQIFSSKLWKWHCGQNSCFSFQCMFLLFTAKFVANIMLPTRCWQHHSSPKEYLKTGSGVKLLARREGILILLNFWK